MYTPVERMHPTQETLDSTNGYKCVFKVVPGLYNAPHHTEYLHMHVRTIPTHVYAQFRMISVYEFRCVTFWFISSKNKLIVNTLVLLISECGSNISFKITVDQQESQQVF